MAGWFLGIEALKSILPVWVSMKFSTALSFFLSGIALYFAARHQKGDRELAVIIIPIACMMILLLMTSLLASTVLGVNVGVEDMFVRDSMEPVGSVVPGRPSVATMINFVIIAMAGILTVMNTRRPGRALAIFGLSVAVIGAMAVLGYIVNKPLLYFSVTGRSSAMALHTAILFVMWGIGAVLTASTKKS
jgi:hypothetical protein